MLSTSESIMHASLQAESQSGQALGLNTYQGLLFLGNIDGATGNSFLPYQATGSSIVSACISSVAHCLR